MSKILIALQLYSVREDCARDLPGTLEAIADIGYDGVEFAGYHGRSAEELRRMLDDLGLKVAGTHIGFDNLLGSQLEESIEFNHSLENLFLIVPSAPERMRRSKASWLKTAHLLNDIAERLSPEGMQVGYHNHTVEFQSVNGEMPWHLVFGATSSKVVMQLDTGHAMRGGLNSEMIFEILKRYPYRAKTVHLKAFSASNEKALLGEGDMKWQKFFSLCETIGGTQWYIVEQEKYPFTPLECVKRCKENLDAMMQ